MPLSANTAISIISTQVNFNNDKQYLLQPKTSGELVINVQLEGVALNLSTHEVAIKTDET